MSKGKNKKIRAEKMTKECVPAYDNRRAIKDIHNNNKHSPKGER